MPGMDPLAAGTIDALAAAQAVFQESALNLGAAVDLLQAQIAVGDLITATILPAHDGYDQISIFGQTVAAELPPGIHPGESLLLQVTGFQGSQILVRNLGIVDPQNPPVSIELQQGAPAAAQTAILTAKLPSQAVTLPVPGPGASGTPQPGAQPSLAPSSAVFVAASVRPGSGPSAQVSEALPLSSSAQVRPEDGVEARIALSRAARTLAPPLQARIQAPLAPARPVLAGTMAHPAPIRPSTPPVVPAGRPATAEESMLSRLRVPISPASLAAARAAIATPSALPRLYEKLDAVLARVASPDPRVGSLRSLLSFVGKFNLGNPRVLSEQIAAFVNHAVAGIEEKYAAIARLAVVAETAPEPGVPIAPQAPVRPRDGATAAQVATRAVTLEHDVKSAMLSLIAAPPAGMPPGVSEALGDALNATTGLQLNVLSAQQTDPSTIAIPLPAVFYDGGKPAQLRIDRDAPDRKTKMDADNFHISFILDTKSLGIVAIDLQTVGRAVSVNVKTERASATDSFRTTFAELRGRLEGLRYRIAAIGAGIATRGSGADSTKLRVDDTTAGPISNVDLRA